MPISIIYSHYLSELERFVKAGVNGFGRCFSSVIIAAENKPI
jgi:hypothetical protein